MLEKLFISYLFFLVDHRVYSDYCQKLPRYYTYSDATFNKPILLLIRLNEYVKIYQHISNLSSIGT